MYTDSSGTLQGGSSKQLHKAASTASQPAQLWQHPFVDVFKHFKVLPQGDWRRGKKQGDVEEIFAKEIGRKALSIAGSISANNFVQVPNPNSLQKSLGLTGRYLYLQVKSAAGSPFSLHFDFSMAERGNNVRVSVSNLFKGFQQTNGFVVQVPLELHQERWTVVCIDLPDLFSRSAMFPASYNLEGAHQLKSMTLCANLQVRGVYTSDNEYDHVTLPSDLRFKFPFENQVATKWPEYFDWHNLPRDWDHSGKHAARAIPPAQDISNFRAKGAAREEERQRMSSEIDSLLNRKHGQQETEEDPLLHQKRPRIGKLPEYSEENVNPASLSALVEEKREKKQTVSLGGLGKGEYVSGQYCGNEFKRSAKLSQDPIVELRHIIGYSPDRCLNLKWARFPSDPNVVIFTSGGTLIAMDVESCTQKRFFFGHSAPICCFDVNANGALIASAQEGKNSIIRIWEYTSGRCISAITMPVNTLKCLAFSFDGKYLASVGKDSHNKELIVVWDITRIGTDKGKAEIVAKQTSDFNVLALRFSPIDSSRMASCGKENIRFWRIKDNGSIRGSAVVLNHHARNTVFTCLDFEYGLRAVDPKENESLKRLFVGSKHGMVFQINYHTESLEATYQTNESAIYGISVNEAFCVTGSEDTYLRVWPLDFSEFFMEAKHEGTVGAVEISPDGLKVVCGTLSGSLGVLDKSNQRYRTVLRSHTDQILHVDFHLGKRIIITVSKDKTIRLWDLATSDQVYEFSSPLDQALCVSAHPSLPLFSCGFESGVLRVFDIERTCVADEFCQFNRPLSKLAYSPSGDLLVTCCSDGGVAIHNPRRQHLPIKMLHLEYPPEHVHVAFTQAPTPDFLVTESDSSQSEAKFAVMGDYGNHVNVYDARTFILAHQLHAAQPLRQFVFANNNRELVVMTADCRLKFYALARFEGLLLREVAAVHRGSITTLSVSNNSGYFLTGGEDSILKVWDFDANKTSPQFFQAFIGHTYPVRSVMFCPSDNATIISAGDKDGIYLWNFYGDVRTQFAHAPEELPEKEVLKESKSSGSVLEKLRNSKKESKYLAQYEAAEIKEGTFVVPAFRAVQVVPPEASGAEDEETSGAQQLVLQATASRKERGLCYIHFNGGAPGFEVSHAPADDSSAAKELPLSVMGGYDGFGGVHDNVVWCQLEGWMAYTLHNKLIFEDVKTRQQTVIADSASQLSTLALSPDRRLLAAAEGRPSSRSGNSEIYLYDTETRTRVKKFTFHQRGVQALIFSNQGGHLISLGVQGENNLAIWDLATGLVVRSCLIKNTSAVHAIQVDPYVGEGHVQFAVVGAQGLFNVYRFEIATGLLSAFEVDNVPAEFKNNAFVSLAYTQMLGGLYFALLGASDGSLTAYELGSSSFLEGGTKKWCITGVIAHVRVANGQVVLASSTGTVARYALLPDALFPTEKAQLTFLRADGPVVSLAMDELNNEGLVGTAFGSLYYLNFGEKQLIRVVSRAYSVPRAVTSVRFCETNPQLVLSNCTCTEGGANGSAVAKVWTAGTLDQVMRFQAPIEQSGPVAFVLSGPSRYQVIAHQQGQIRLLNTECLKVELTFKLPLKPEEEVLTCGAFNPNGVNVALGTSQGQVFIGSLRQDAQGKPKAMVGRLDIHGATRAQAVTAVHFSAFDPIGSFLIAFDNGIVRTWQSSVRNEQLMKLLELQQQDPEGSTPTFDLSESGFQIFDVVDHFDMFENPHGQEDLGELERAQLRLLYQGKRHPRCEARFSPARSSADIYLAFVAALQYVYVRNYVQGAIVKRVSLLHFPTCFALAEYPSVEDSAPLGGEQVLAIIGTKEGKVLSYKISSAGSTLLAETRTGITYGGIAAVDVSLEVGKVVAATESGELFTAELHLEK